MIALRVKRRGTVSGSTVKKKKPAAIKDVECVFFIAAGVDLRAPKALWSCYLINSSWP